VSRAARKRSGFVLGGVFTEQPAHGEERDRSGRDHGEKPPQELRWRLDEEPFDRVEPGRGRRVRREVDASDDFVQLS
jgi:hypothetical protein